MAREMIKGYMSIITTSYSTHVCQLKESLTALCATMGSSSAAMLGSSVSADTHSIMAASSRPCKQYFVLGCRASTFSSFCATNFQENMTQNSSRSRCHRLLERIRAVR